MPAGQRVRPRIQDALARPSGSDTRSEVASDPVDEKLPFTATRGVSPDALQYGPAEPADPALFFHSQTAALCVT